MPLLIMYSTAVICPVSQISISGFVSFSLSIPADSMHSFEMVAALEDHYGIDIPFESLQDVKTIQDVAESVMELLRLKEEAKNA